MTDVDDGKARDTGRSVPATGVDADADHRVLDVTDVNGHGQGVARADGLVVFVAGAVAGDRVEARITRRHRRHAEARLLKVVRPAEHRVDPACPVQAACGGCPLMTLETSAALSLKVRHLEQTLRRIGGIALTAEDVAGSPRALRYRGRVRFAVAADGGRRVPAYRAAGSSRELVPVADCPIGPPGAAAAASAALQAAGADVPIDEIEVRASTETDALLVVLHGPAPPDRALRRAAASLVRTHDQIAGVAHASSGRGRGRRVTHLAGVRRVPVRIGDVEVCVGATGFVQVNPGAAALLYDIVARETAAEPGDEVLDLYSGVGLAALAAARSGACALGVESDRAAVKAGVEVLARHPSGARVRLVRGDAGHEVARLAAEKSRIAVVVANPPRSGLGKGTARSIAALGPRRGVLVSCHAATLARDAAALGAHGLRATRLSAIDMFPATAHVEAVLTLMPAREEDP